MNVVDMPMIKLILLKLRERTVVRRPDLYTFLARLLVADIKSEALA